MPALAAEIWTRGLSNSLILQSSLSNLEYGTSLAGQL
jgi:hypothetical protein